MTTPQKCLHKSCGKTFTSPDEECVYHPGPPVFHEGQKGWKCCKPRVLTFDEFLAIPPCTTGKHSAVDDTPAEPPKPVPDAPSPASLPAPQPRATPTSTAAPTPPPEPEPEPDSDEEGATIPPNTTCKRRGCGKKSPNKPTASAERSDEECVHHPGHPIFHEGQKGWQCCKPRVLSFDEFLELKGCTTKPRHLFVGKPKSEAQRKKEVQTKDLKGVRQDFYQTPTTLNLSLFIKGVDKDEGASSVRFGAAEMDVKLTTAGGEVFHEVVELYAGIDAEKSAARILGTKVEITLVKLQPGGWPVLRKGEAPPPGQILQVGGAGRA